MRLPRLLALRPCDDDRDVVAWALVLPDGSAVTASTTSPPEATLWPSLDDAAIALDVDVDEIRPRRRWVEQGR